MNIKNLVDTAELSAENRVLALFLVVTKPLPSNVCVICLCYTLQ